MKSYFGKWQLLSDSASATRWRLQAVAGSVAALERSAEGALRIAIAEASEETTWHIQLGRTGLKTVAGGTYLVYFQARADEERTIGVGVALAHSPWTNVGLYDCIELSTEWKPFCWEFVATADDDNVGLHFDVGGNSAAVELTSLAWRDMEDASASADGDGIGSSGRPAPLAGALLKATGHTRVRKLGSATIGELANELLARLESAEFETTDEQNVLLGRELRDALDRAIDVHTNRWSAKRYSDLFQLFFANLSGPPSRLVDATVLDLGCGALNPFGMVFLSLMLGARRGIAVDLDEIQNVPRALNALAELAAMMAIDPRLILGRKAIPRERLLANVATFDLGKLRAGQPTGIDPTRLELRRESVYSLTLRDGEVDVVISNAFFEHIPRPEAAIAELARVTKKGGLGIHNIDTSDHRRYWDRARHPLEFLTEVTTEPLSHGSNRLRPWQFVSLFERHGFELVKLGTGDEAELTPDLLNRLVEPYRSDAGGTAEAVPGNAFGKATRSAN